MTTTIANFTDTAAGWQRALYAFLAEKEPIGQGFAVPNGFKIHFRRSFVGIIQ